MAAGAEGAMAGLSLGDGNGKATPLAGTNEGNASLLKLEELGQAYALYQHAEATTIEEQAAHVGHLPGVLTKNLLLRVRVMLGGGVCASMMDGGVGSALVYMYLSNAD